MCALNFRFPWVPSTPPVNFHRFLLNQVAPSRLIRTTHRLLVRDNLVYSTSWKLTLYWILNWVIVKVWALWLLLFFYMWVHEWIALLSRYDNIMSDSAKLMLLLYQAIISRLEQTRHILDSFVFIVLKQYIGNVLFPAFRRAGVHDAASPNVPTGSSHYLPPGHGCTSSPTVPVLATPTRLLSWPSCTPGHARSTPHSVRSSLVIDAVLISIPAGLRDASVW